MKSKKEFDLSLDSIRKFKIDHGGFSSGYSTFEIGYLKPKDKNIYSKIDIFGGLSIDLINNGWEEFKEFLINDVGINKWTENYYDKSILDGTQWEIVIKSKDNSVVKIFGSNDYPKNYWKLLKYINKIVGFDVFRTR